MRYAADWWKMLGMAVVVGVLCQTCSVAREREQHSVSAQLFAIPMASETSSTVGWGYVLDYEYQFTDHLGAYVAYLYTSYTDEWTMPSASRPGNTIHDEDDVEMGGPLFGLRYHYPYIAPNGAEAIFFWGGGIGFWSKEDTEVSERGQVEQEDVTAFVFSFGAEKELGEAWTLGGGTDFGAITGAEGGPFVTIFLRASYLFSL